MSNTNQEKSFYSSRAIAKHQGKQHSYILKIVRGLMSQGLLVNTVSRMWVSEQNHGEYEEFISDHEDMELIISKVYVRPPPKSHGYKRKEITWELRKAVFERDAYRCKGCGDWHDLCVDHILPVARGGCKDIDNLQTLCRPCNSKKGTKTMEEWLEVCNASN